MRSRKASAAVVAAVVMPSVAIGGALPAAGAADEPALPSHPFFGHMTLSKGQTKAVGPATGTLGVSSITIKGLTCVAANVTTTLSQSSAVELNFNGFSQ